MRIKNIKKYSGFFLITILLYLLERGEMSLRFYVYEASFAYQNYIIIAMIVLSAIYIALNKAFSPHNKLFYRFATTLIVIYVITVLWSLANPLSSRNVYGYFILPLFMFIYIYVYTRVIDNIDVILYSMYVVGVLLAVFFFMNYNNNILYDVERQTNTSYFVLYILPFMLCAPKKWLRYLAIVLAFFTVMFSLKRGGFVAVILAVAVYLYINQVKMGGKRFKIWSWFVFLAVGVLGFMVIIRINNVLLDNRMFNRMSLIEETGGSGREKVFRNVIYLIESQGFGNYMIGHGWRATAENTISHLTAHNDFLEILYDFGIVAFVFYIMMIIELFRLTKSLIRKKSEYAPAMGACLAIFFVNSMVSHIMIYCQYLLLFAMFWGFISATNHKQNQIKSI